MNYIKTLEDTQLEFTDQEKEMLASCINHKGGTDHPAANTRTLPYFSADYAEECAIASVGCLTPEGQEILNGILDKFNSL